MNKIVKRVAFAAAVLLAPSVAQAQFVDQSNYGPDGYTGPYTGVGYSNTRLANTYFGQWFVPTQNNIIALNVLLFNSSASAKDVTLYSEVYSGLDDSFVSEGAVTIEGVGAGTYFQGFHLVTPGILNAGDPYYIYFLVDGFDSDIHIIEDLTAGYTDGVAFTLSEDLNDYSELEGDLVFEEYYEASPTPEPASMILLATGLLGVVGVAHRRRKQA